MISVLLVDDHELIRTGVRGILDNAPDIEVVAEAATGEEAIELVKTLPQVDVILMDVNMPGMGGIEATRRVLRVNPDIKVIALTMLWDRLNAPRVTFSAMAVLLDQAMDAGLSWPGFLNLLESMTRGDHVLL